MEYKFLEENIVEIPSWAWGIQRLLKQYKNGTKLKRNKKMIALT